MSKRKIIRAIELIPFYLISAGILLMPTIQNYLREQAIQNQLSGVVYAQADTQQVHPVSGRPVRIIVASKSINLPVHIGRYNPDTKDWTLADDAAFFAEPTTLPNNQGGRTIIYGHNIRQVFGNLHNLTAGDEAVVYTQNHLWFKYRFIKSANVDPSNVKVLLSTRGNHLTLITCSGFFSQHRQLLHFSFVGYGKR